MINPTVKYPITIHYTITEKPYKELQKTYKMADDRVNVMRGYKASVLPSLPLP